MKSKYDPSRETVGTIYRDAQLAHKVDEQITNGDMTHEMAKSLVDDLNDTIKQGTIDFEGRVFFVTVHEKKDLQMKRCLLRRMIKTEYRPYPEDDTIVFKVYPSCADVRFCWCLPHHTEMKNMLDNDWLFDVDMVYKIRCWQNMDLYNFGFTKDEKGNWIENPSYHDAKMEPTKKQIIKPSSFII